MMKSAADFNSILNLNDVLVHRKAVKLAEEWAKP
jgi:hypothetical protein